MVLVDVFVPAVDMTYNFSLNEEMPIASIIDEITEMIGQKEQTHLYGAVADLNLYSQPDARVLPKQNSLADCLVTTGTTLMLI